MRTVVVVVIQPVIQVRLDLLDRSVDLPAKRDLIKLLQYRFVEPLADSVRLRVAHLGFRVLDVVEREIELVIV